MDVSRIVKENDKVVFDFYAEWCAPCKIMEPAFKKLEEETDIKVVKVDVDKEQDLAQLFGIQSIPTTVYYKDGEQVDTKVGAIPIALMLNVFA